MNHFRGNIRMRPFAILLLLATCNMPHATCLAKQPTRLPAAYDVTVADGPTYRVFGPVEIEHDEAGRRWLAYSHYYYYYDRSVHDCGCCADAAAPCPGCDCCQPIHWWRARQAIAPARPLEVREAFP